MKTCVLILSVLLFCGGCLFVQDDPETLRWDVEEPGVPVEVDENDEVMESEGPGDDGPDVTPTEIPPPPEEIEEEPPPIQTLPCTCPTVVEHGRDYIAGCGECDDIDYVCPLGWQPFEDACGCGCERVRACLDDLEENVAYVAEHPTCGVIFYSCDPGWDHFENQCGCGCVQSEKCDVPDEQKEYVATHPQCSVIRFSCEPGTRGFEDQCGCGCEVVEGCLDGRRDTVEYVAESPQECAVIDYVCPNEWVAFDNECGCGCVALQLGPG